MRPQVRATLDQMACWRSFGVCQQFASVPTLKHVFVTIHSQVTQRVNRRQSVSMAHEDSVEEKHPRTMEQLRQKLWGLKWSAPPKGSSRNARWARRHRRRARRDSYAEVHMRRTVCGFNVLGSRVIRKGHKNVAREEPHIHIVGIQESQLNVASRFLKTGLALVWLRTLRRAMAVDMVRSQSQCHRMCAQAERRRSSSSAPTKALLVWSPSCATLTRTSAPALSAAVLVFTAPPPSI